MSQLMMLRPAGAPRPDVADGRVRPATAADREKLARLLGRAFPEHEWTVERVSKDLLDAPDVPIVYVIDEGTDIIATASVRYQDRFADSGYVHWVGVDPQHRGKRLGTTVMDAVISRFVADGRTSAILETDDFRLPAITSYLGQGFIPHYADADHQDRWSNVFGQLALARRAAKEK